MSKYEYLVEAINAKSEKDMQVRLNVLGEDGWDLISCDSVNGFFRFILKREIEFAVGLK